MSASPLNWSYEFGPFRLDAPKRLLLREGQVVALTPKAFDTLLVLVQNGGRPISRDDLMKAVWPDAFVEEGNLTQNIFVLRKALGSHNRYIVTIPGRGYQFVEEVRQTNEPEEVSPQERTSDPEWVHPDRTSPRLLNWALVALVLLTLAGVAGLLLYPGRGAQPGIGAALTASVAAAVPARPSVAVLGFRNSSGRAQEQWISTALSEMLNTELAAGNQLRMISGEDVARARRESPLPDVASLSKLSLRRLRAQLGSDMVVLGAYATLPAKDGERIRFDLRLQDTRTGETLAEESASGSRDQLFQLVAQLGSQLRQKLGISELSSEQAEQVRATADANPVAARLYAQGLDKLRAFDAVGARELLQKAVAADPNRALFHSALAESWAVLGYDSEAQAEAKRAFELSGDSSRRDQLLVEGRYRELTRNLPAAAEIYRTLWNFFPDDIEYGLRLASVQTKAGLGKEALQTIARMRRLPEAENRDPRIDLAEAVTAESLSDFARTLKASSTAAAKARARGSSLLLAEALRQQGYAYDRLGRPADSIPAYEKARALWAAAGDQYGAAAALHSIAVAQYYKGDFADAGRSFQDALRVFRRIGALWAVASCSHNFAMLLHDEGKLPQAKQALEEALRIQRQLNDERGVASDLDDLGNVLLAMGDLPAAARFKQQAAESFHRIGNRLGEAITLGNWGEVLFAQGELSPAKQKFEQSLKLKQQTGYKRGLAFAWTDLANVLLAQGQLAQARALAMQAITLRQQLGDEFNLALSRLQLAQIALQQGQAAEAESLARNAAAVFHNRKVFDSGAMAQAVLSRALLTQGKIKEALASSEQAMALAEKGGDREGRFQALLAAAAVQVATGQAAQARQLLQALHSESGRYGYLGYELQSRLRLAELELKSDPGSARGRLARLQRDAQMKGFLLIARQAETALRSRSST